MRKFLIAALLCLLAPQALALTVPGADGSDGVFNPLSSVEVDLGLAVNGTWDATPGTGDGVYDADKWAVVFKYTSVDIPAGVTVTFANHPKKAPVVWLVQGDVSIAGVVSLNGDNQTGATVTPSQAGPGGFRGGAGKPSSATEASGGFGPGGGLPGNPGGGGDYGTDGAGASRGVYGRAELIPLLGGSGGGADGNDSNRGGGAGGGAILIVAGGTITVDGTVRANGGNGDAFDSGGGSGGAIRLVAETVNGAGQVQAVEGDGGNADGGLGRIRLEANSITVTTVQPPASQALPLDPPDVWPDATYPTLRATHIDYIDAQGMPQTILIPTDPGSSLDFPNADAAFETDMAVDLYIEATNVPLDWTITALITPRAGTHLDAVATFQSGDETLSTWAVQGLLLSGGFSAIQIRGDAP